MKVAGRITPRFAEKETAFKTTHWRMEATRSQGTRQQ